MSDLESFRQRVEERIASLTCGVAVQPQALQQEMAALESRLARLEAEAAAILDDVILPRLKIVAACFPNAYIKQGKWRDRCEFWLGYCERFPASVKVEFSLEHDDAVEHLVIYYTVRITPVFLKYDPADKLVVAPDQTDSAGIAEWTEQKLLAFLGDYLRLDRGDESQDDELSTDPVCGMRIRRVEAAGQFDYRGHLYFFCMDECRQKFEKDPSRYIWFKTA